MVFISIALMVCALVFTTGSYAKKALDSKPAQHVHKWWTEGQTLTPVYRTGYERPVRYETYFSQSCEGCGEKRIDIQEGRWTSIDEQL